MPKVLWKELNATDFNGMTGAAAVSDTGGGARHIVLGKSRSGNDIAGFLPSGHGDDVTVQTEPGPGWPKSTLSFSSNPARRSGEWLIGDQKNHRHPAWSAASGFPTSFNASNPPFILVFEISGKYHVAWLDKTTLSSLAPTIAAAVRGVAPVPPKLLSKLKLGEATTFEQFSKTEDTQPSPTFDPRNQEDGRKRILAEVVRRQGQRKFRKELMTAYSGRCAITGCSVEWVLEAAHISPYLGPHTNKADNGLLLRADIHTLFDLGLISVDPAKLLVRVAGAIIEPEYRALDGRKLAAGKVAPSKAALQEHWDRSTA